MKDAEPAELERGIRAAARGESPLDPRAARVLIGERAPSAPTGLSARELEVLVLLAAGHPNKRIARELGIAERTVKAHLTSVFRRAGVTDRVQAVLWAQRQGLFPGEGSEPEGAIAGAAGGDDRVADGARGAPSRRPAPREGGSTARPRAARLTLVALVLSIILAGSLIAVAAPGASTVKVTMGNGAPYQMSATKSAKAGKVTFSVTNRGRMAHEFVVIRTATKASKLKVRNGKAEDKGDVGEIEMIAPGKTAKLRLSLKAGHYALICNYTGHYAAGMRVDLTVTK